MQHLNVTALRRPGADPNILGPMRRAAPLLAVSLLLLGSCGLDALTGADSSGPQVFFAAHTYLQDPWPRREETCTQSGRSVNCSGVDNIGYTTERQYSWTERFDRHGNVIERQTDTSRHVTDWAKGAGGRYFATRTQGYEGEERVLLETCTRDGNIVHCTRTERGVESESQRTYDDDGNLVELLQPGERWTYAWAPRPGRGSFATQTRRYSDGSGSADYAQACTRDASIVTCRTVTGFFAVDETFTYDDFGNVVKWYLDEEFPVTRTTEWKLLR